MQFIVINNPGGDSVTFPVDTPEQTAIAQSALRDMGLDQADVWSGDPDTDDSVNTGNKIFAVQKFRVTLTEKTADTEKTAVVVAEDEREAIRAAVVKLYGKAATWSELGMVDGSFIHDRGQVYRRERDGSATRVTGMTWAEVESLGK